MIGQLREKLNEMPPWATYSAVGVAVVILIGVVVYKSGGGSGRVDRPKHFYFPDTDHGITVSSKEAREMLHEAAKANPKGRGYVKNPKSGEYTGVTGRKCPKCGIYFEPPESSGSIFPDSFRDECPDPKCGYSEHRENTIKSAFEAMKKGTYDPDKIPAFMREAIEEAEESGKYDHLKK